MKLPSHYEKYKLSRILSINEFVSADYVYGTHPDANHHTHNDAWELVYCLEGNVEVLKDTKYISLPQDMMLIIPPGTTHDSISRYNNDRALYISFTADADCLNVLSNVVIPVSTEASTLFLRVIDELSHSFELNEGELRISRFVPSSYTPFGSEQMMCCYLEIILIDTLRELTKQDGQLIPTEHFERATDTMFIENIQNYIAEHITEELTVQGIADNFHYSRTRLSTLCRSITGYSVNQLITGQRIMMAKQMLIEQKLSITEIAEKTGFTSAQYFSRRFHQVAGCTPSEFMRNYLLLEAEHDATDMTV